MLRRAGTLAPRRTAADYRAFRASLVAGAALAPTDEDARRAAG